VRAAQAWGVRPLVVLRGEVGARWTDVDRVLAVAHVLTGDMLCPGCGQPKHESWNPDSEGWYEVRDAVCAGCSAVAADAGAHKDKKQPGRHTWMVDTRPSDVPLRPWNPD
jgi:hypothetical protein